MKDIYYHGQVYAGDGQFCQAFLVEDGLIAAAGRDEEILAMATDGTRCHDLAGWFVVSGFNDSHMHLLGLGGSLSSAQLSNHTGSLQEMLDYLKEYARENPPSEGRWLTGRGWNQDYFTDAARMPDRHDLDLISTEYPVMLTRACGHCCVINTPLLKLAGITGEEKIEGGSVGMENGHPDGRLYDNAINLLTPYLPVPDKEEVKRRIRLACRMLSSYGITSVQSDDYSVNRQIPFETINAAYRELEAEGELSVRVYEQANFTSLSQLQRFVEAGNITGKGSSKFRIGPLKMLGDGSLGSYTACLSRPYADKPDTRGLLLFSAEQMNEMVRYANEHGMQVAIHAIGDACLDQVLDAVDLALKEKPRADHRHGVVHCQISRPDQLRRIRDLQMHVYAQSIFLDYDNHIVASRVGDDMASTSYSWKTLMKEGVSVSNGSDSPVEPPDVMRGIQCAVTRTSLDGTGPYLPQEAFTLEEALDSFTICGARASFEEDRKGRIAPGCYADFTILGQNPFETEPNQLHQIPVTACYLGGRRIFGAPFETERN
ncbi:MAG: amidohydrolase [Firmicutes bacterium]|nr:amidohydrolase [Bacillota bacterium]